MYKQVIIVRKDLKLSAGKIASQSSHASVSSYKKVKSKYPKIADSWESEGQKKIVLKVQSEEELFKYLQETKDAKIPCELIRDAGHTQIDPGTVTCLGVGPWDEQEIDKIFGKLKLL